MKLVQDLLYKFRVSILEKIRNIFNLNKIPLCVTIGIGKFFERDSYEKEYKKNLR